MPDESSKENQEPEEPGWTYKGYRLKSSEFVSAMAHEFRSDVQRANLWRTRLDATTNWAVVVTGVSISIAFSQPNTHHGVIILNALLITLFLFIEARRYRYYEMWNYRVRLMETDFFAALLAAPFHPSSKWAESLAENILHFTFPISMWDAVGLRLRRNYLWIFFVITLAWLAKYWLFPAPATNFLGFISRAAIGPVPGTIVVSLSVAYFGVLALIAILTLGKGLAIGEAVTRFSENDESGFRGKPKHASDKSKKPHNWLNLWQRQKQLLVLIVTAKSDPIAKLILSESGRGVTSIPSKESTMLVCALPANELRNLKTVVVKEDPQAIIHVLPAREILGGGFNPLLDE